MNLSAKTIEIVKATAPLVGSKAKEITATFYPILFADYPQVKSLFNQSHQKSGAQPEALANAIVAYALNIDNLGALSGAVEEMAERHASLNIRPEHYPMVGASLMKAISQVLGDAVTEEVAAAWTEAYQFLADLLISVERGKYDATLAKPGGWEGYKAFKVVKKERESASITSFYLQPSDGSTIIPYEAGQYISVQVQIPGSEVTVRNYSLSDWDADYLRISVKKDGKISTYLHEETEVGSELLINAPYGVLKLNESDKEVVLISGGVGITPMLSMLKQLTKSGSQRKVSFLHGAASPVEHAFGEEVKFLCESSGASYEFAYADEGKRISLETIQKACGSNKNAEFYVCGPAAMMKAIYSALSEWGVESSNIFYEYFGPKGAISS